MIASAISRTTSLQTVTLNCQPRCSVSPCARGKKFVEGRPLDDFVFAALRIAAAAIEILVEKRGDVEIVKGTGGLGLGNFFGFGFQEGFVAVILAG